MKVQLTSLLNLLFAVAPALVHSVTPPGASTPEFYLVSSSTTAGANLLPLRSVGGTGGYASLTGTSPIGIYYFINGVLTAAPDSTSSIPQRALIGPVLSSTSCSTYGALGFTPGSSSNKCALYNPFTIQSNIENSQMGAKLVFNGTGGFYACGSGLDVWYQPSSTNGPPGLTCNPIGLWTVTVS